MYKRQPDVAKLKTGGAGPLPEHLDPDLPNQFPGFLSLFASQRLTECGVGAQAQRLALSIVGVIEALAMRATFDEEQKVEAGAITQPLSRVTRLDRLDRGVRGDEVLRHAMQ